jgi:hypothetical protein
MPAIKILRAIGRREAAPLLSWLPTDFLLVRHLTVRHLGHLHNVGQILMLLLQRLRDRQSHLSRLF